MAIYKLGDILEVKDNYRSSLYPKPNEILNNGIPFIKVADIKDFRIENSKDYISEKKYNELPTKGKIFNNSLLISAYGTITVAISSLEMAQMSSGLKEIVPNEKIVLKKYLYYWLIKNVSKLSEKSSVFEQLTISKFISSSITVPSISEQQKIIDIIEPIEQLILSINKISIQVKLLEQNLYNEIKKNNKSSFSEIVKVNKQKIKTLDFKNIIAGVGYNGFTDKHGKISPFSKVVKEDSFVIGLISKEIPIAFNYSEKNYSVSTAYFVFESKDIPVKCWWTFMFVLKNWQSFVKRTSRQGQSFETEKFVNTQAPYLNNQEWQEYNDIYKKIKKIKNCCSDVMKTIEKEKGKLLSLLIR